MIKIHPFIASRFRTDGGVMFGLVPRVIWTRLIKPDERNTIAQNVNILLIELSDGRKGLVDTGCGNPEHYPEKARKIHGFPEGWPLKSGLEKRGVAFEDIEFIIATHCHWDHIGAFTRGDGSPLFPNAELIIHQEEWEDATSGDPLLYKSYPSSVINPLKAHANKRLVQEDDSEIFPGIHMIRTGGHTRGHCCLKIRGEDMEVIHPDSEKLGPIQELLYTGDVCPTHDHLRMVFHTAYDTFPLDTRRWKRDSFREAAETRSLVLFCHDADFAGGLINSDPKVEFLLDERCLRAVE